MPASADITFSGFNSNTRTPEFQINIGTNVNFRIDITTDSNLFEPGTRPQRNPQNYQGGSVINHPQGGVTTYVIPNNSWSQLNLGGGRAYYKLTSWDANNRNLIRSVNFGQSASTPYVNTVGTAPDPPTNVIISLQSDTSVNISWSAPMNDGGSSISGYRIERQTSGGTLSPVGSTNSNQLSFLDSGLTPNTNYGYQIRATNSLGTSSPSNITTVTTPQQQPIHIEIDLPEISSPRKNGLYGEYDLSTDEKARSDGQNYPLTSVVFRVQTSQGGVLSPVPDGTSIRISYQSPPPNSIESKGGTGMFLDLNDRQLLSNIVTTTNGEFRCLFLASSSAESWRVNPTNNQLEPIYPDVFAITAETLDGQFSGTSHEITIVAGDPNQIQIIHNPSDIGFRLQDIQGPNGQPLALGSPVAIMNGVQSNYMTNHGQGTATINSLPIRLSSITPNNRVTGGQALWILAKVTDKDGNPIQILNNTVNREYYWMVGTIIRFPFNTVPGFFIPDDLQWRDYPDGKMFFARRRSFLPPGVVDALYVPSIMNPGHQEFLSLDVYYIENQVSTHIVEKRLTINTAEDPQVVKLRRWLFEGQVSDVETFVYEIGISLIPFVGDGRDILIHSWRGLTGRPLTGWDHATFALASMGLALDVANIFSVGGTVPIDAFVAGLKAFFKFARRLFPSNIPRCFDIFIDVVRRALERQNITAVEEFGEKAGKFGEKVIDLIRHQETAKLERLVTLMGLTVFSLQALEAVFTLFKNHSVDEVLFLLQFMVDGIRVDNEP